MNRISVPPADVDARLRDAFASVLGIAANDVHPALDRAGTANWSSLNHLLLISELELRFGVAFSNGDIMSIETYADLGAVLTRLLPSARP